MFEKLMLVSNKRLISNQICSLYDLGELDGMAIYNYFENYPHRTILV